MEQEATPDVMNAIRAHYDNMSKSQQKVAEFFLTRGLEAIYLPAARIAELAGVSHSTVVRTAQAIGFEGFPNFQAALQEQFLGRINSASAYQLGSRKLIGELRDQNEDASAAQILQRAMLSDAHNIELMATQISIPDFERAIDWLINAPNIHVIGLRSSAPLALNFSNGLRQIRPNCTLLRPDFGDLVDQVAAIAKGDVLVSICFGRYMRDTLHCMDYAREVGAKVIAMTDTPLSPAAKRADLVFAVRHGVWFYGASASLFSLFNALIAALLVRQSASAQQRLEYVDAIIDRFQIFEPLKSTDPHSGD